LSLVHDHPPHHRQKIFCRGWQKWRPTCDGLREADQRTRSLQGKPDALATVAANLYYENCQLKKKLAPQSMLQITALDAPQAAR
jgi:hypothetical protein